MALKQVLRCVQHMHLRWVGLSCVEQRCRMSVSGNISHFPSKTVVRGGVYGSPKPFGGHFEPLNTSELGGDPGGSLGTVNRSPVLEPALLRLDPVLSTLPSSEDVEP